MLSMTSKMWFASAVILVIAIWSDYDYQQYRPIDQEEGFAFGGWMLPEVVPLVEEITEAPLLDLQIEAPEEFRFFRVRSGGRPDSEAIAFIHRESALIGSIRPFDPESETWPPDRSMFGSMPSLTFADLGFTDEENGIFDLPMEELFPGDSLRLRVQSILYPGYRCLWVTPRNSPQWPLRIHIGRLESEDHPTLILRMFEFEATGSDPNYETGPIAELAESLRPLS